MSRPPARAPHPALAAWTALRQQANGRGALVTLVKADGASKPEGAHLALAADGRAFGSVTIGGCADGRALVVAADVLRTGERQSLTVPLGEEDALALGLGCAGDIDLLVERVGHDERDPITAAMEAAEASLERGARAVLVTPLDGSTGRFLLSEGGPSAGSTGSHERDAAAKTLAVRALRGGDASTGVHEAGGSRWLVQLLTPVRTVVIVGATDVAAALCVMVAPLGWISIIVDPRDELLTDSRFDAASERHAALPAELVTARAVGKSAAVVVVAHDYKVELPVLRVALRGSAAYVGMLGSRKRAASIRALLADDGLTEAELARLRAPIGLSIGAQGAAEIAVSIVAELVETWRSAVRSADGQSS